jgi:hypothetical protein
MLQGDQKWGASNRQRPSCCPHLLHPRARHSYRHCHAQRYQIEAASFSLTRAIHTSLQRQLAQCSP